MNNLEKHSGGCACGKVRYHSIGKPARTGLCHCRYCQLRTGTAFGISVYFNIDKVKIEPSELKKLFKNKDLDSIFREITLKR